MFAPRRIEFQSRPVGDPYRRNPGMVQRRRKFIQASDALAARGNQTIDSYIENARRLAQARAPVWSIILCGNAQLSEAARDNEVLHRQTT